MRTDTLGMVFFFIISAILFYLAYMALISGHIVEYKVITFCALIPIVIGLLIKSKFKLK